MRTPDPVSRDRLLQLLRATPRRRTTELAALLGVTPQSVRRLLAELPGIPCSSAGPHPARPLCAAPPLARHAGRPSPVRVDATGRASIGGGARDDSARGNAVPFGGNGMACPSESRDGWWDGLPYPVYAIRPQGYMGRQLARAEHRALDGVRGNPDEWSDDDILWVLSQRGTDVPGNLLLGDAAYDAWFRSGTQGSSIRPASRPKPASYAELAAPGRRRGRRRLVRGGRIPQVRRPCGRLVGCLHAARAGEVLRCRRVGCRAALGRPVGVRAPCARVREGVSPVSAPARSRMLSHGGRVFIELERFDRVGLQGRRGRVRAGRNPPRIPRQS